MRIQQSSTNWAQSSGGYRGSPLLFWGAVGYCLVSVLNLVALVATNSSLAPGNPAYPVLLSLWVVTLLVLGTGFLWTGVNPFMTRFGILVGLYVYLLAGYLLVYLVKPGLLAISPNALVLERTFLIGIFAYAERRFIGPKAAGILGLGVVLQFARITLLTLGYYPAWTYLAESILSVVLMSLTAYGIYLTSREVHKVEELWARDNQIRPESSIGDFNNPNHPQ